MSYPFDAAGNQTAPIQVSGASTDTRRIEHLLLLILKQIMPNPGDADQYEMCWCGHERREHTTPRSSPLVCDEFHERPLR